ncbi:MAG: hypothetical protein ABR958_04050 [Dehalococcoidales bacterium]
MNITIAKSLWNEIVDMVEKRLSTEILKKPIVFALYTPEDNNYMVIGYREIPTVRVKGNYPKGDYDYTYPGIKKEGFYPPKGNGRWFSGTLVVGDGTDLDASDKEWMVKEQLYFRIKMDKTENGNLQLKTYCIDFPEILLDLKI